ncbi:MAG: transposase [Myxococcales bacterium]|nr:transposase [Myxococcales bacterium]
MSATNQPPADTSPSLKPKRRSRPLRVERDDVPIFVTNRTVEERFWLHPLLSCAAQPVNGKARRVLKALDRQNLKRFNRLAERANARSGPNSPKFTGAQLQRIAKGLVGSALARAQHEHGVKIYAFICMSNHIHMVVSTPGKNLAFFMRDFKSVTARVINAITGRRGPLWGRRYDAEPILDDAAAAGRVGYTAGNPKKAKLLQDPEEWPGLNLCFGLQESHELEFEYLDYEAWREDGAPKDRIDDFFTSATLVLSPLPACEGMAPEDYARDVRAWIDAVVREEGPASGKMPKGAPRPSSSHGGFAGVDAVLNATFEHRPKDPAFRQRPYCFGSRENRKKHFEDMNNLYGVYDGRSERFRAGDWTVQFPEGTYPPPIVQAAASPTLMPTSGAANA